MNREVIIKLVADNKLNIKDEVMIITKSFKYIQAELKGIDILKEEIFFSELGCSYVENIAFSDILNIRKLDIDKRCYDLTEPKSFNKSFDATNNEILDIINGEMDTLEDNILGMDVNIELKHDNLKKETIKGVIKSVELWSINIDNRALDIQYLITIKDEFEELKACNSKYIKSFKIGKEAIKK